MADKEQLALLQQGVPYWNAWRTAHPEMIHPNLSIADLSGANLIKANFSEADLSEANLSGADLSDATLWKADLQRTDLQRTNLSEASLNGAILIDAKLMRADLSEADLSGADLWRADLSDANFSEANLERAELSGADLSGADLSGARVGLTIFGDVDLRTVKGLETVEHGAPSTIGIDTIIRSQGKIPEVFLRKAGVPDSIIEAIPSLVGSLSPIDYYSCFLSYSSKDEAFAKRLYADLQSNHVRCWFAPEDMKIGDRIRSRIDESIRMYNKLLLVLSEHSVSSKWVEFEVEAAMDKEQEGKPSVLFPVRLDNTVMESTTAWAAHIKRTRNIGDFTRWKNHDDYQKAFNRLLRDLKAEA